MVGAGAPKSTPPVILKPRAEGGGGSATAATIQKAIDGVAPGGTVQVLPGTYREAIRITKGLTLEASGERTGPVIIAPPGAAENAIVIETNEPVTLRALTVHVRGVYGIHGVRFDGLEAFIIRGAPPLPAGFDLWVSTRETVLDSWSDPITLGSVVNSADGDESAHIASHGQTLYFESSRAGGAGRADLYMTTRTKR